ncbi:MAG TPA: hypothetical protein VEB64_08150 [Azospirillaceae bacterium]|nr:hypothetical protein [Azospirillaceae bacterium]
MRQTWTWMAVAVGTLALSGGVAAAQDATTRGERIPIANTCTGPDLVRVQTMVKQVPNSERRLTFERQLFAANDARADNQFTECSRILAEVRQGVRQEMATAAGTQAGTMPGTTAGEGAGATLPPPAPMESPETPFSSEQGGSGQ